MRSQKEGGQRDFQEAEIETEGGGGKRRARKNRQATLDENSGGEEEVVPGIRGGINVHVEIRNSNRKTKH